MRPRRWRSRPAGYSAPGRVWLLYLARLGNALACVALVAGALRIMRAGREAGLLIAFLPMSLALMTSASPDEA